MSQNGQTHFKNLVTNAARFLKCVWPFYRPAKSHCLTVRLTVLTQISKSHGQAQNPHGKLISWKKFYLVLVHRFFHVFKNKNNPSWSLIVLLMQIGKFQINAWVFLASLPCTGCWFPSKILKLVIFSVHQKDEIAFLVSLCNLKDLS